MITLISIILDIFDYKIFNSSSLLLSLFSIVSLLFLKKDKNYYIKLFVLGFIYDFLFTNYLINPFLFMILGFIINKIYKTDNSIIVNIFTGILILFIYQLLLYLTGINKYDFIFILKHYIIINIPYTYILSILKRK